MNHIMLSLGLITLLVSAQVVAVNEETRTSIIKDGVYDEFNPNWTRIPVDWAPALEAARRAFAVRGGKSECFVMYAKAAAPSPNVANSVEDVMEVSFTYSRDYFSVRGAGPKKSRAGCGESITYYMSKSGKIVSSHLQR